MSKTIRNNESFELKLGKEAQKKYGKLEWACSDPAVLELKEIDGGVRVTARGALTNPAVPTIVSCNSDLEERFDEPDATHYYGELAVFVVQSGRIEQIDMDALAGTPSAGIAAPVLHPVAGEPATGIAQHEAQPHETGVSPATAFRDRTAAAPSGDKAKALSELHK